MILNIVFAEILKNTILQKQLQAGQKSIENMSKEVDFL